jgi:hypothetical protein
MKLIAGATALACAALLLAGCASGATSGGSGSSGNGSANNASGASAAEVHPTPSGPRPNFVPAVDAASAQANQRLFVMVLEQALVAEGMSANPSSTANRLSAVGFDPAGISWTDPSTAIGLLSDTVFVSAQVGAGCLIGQYGVSIQTIAVSVVPALASGGCLVGTGINHF